MEIFRSSLFLPQTISTPLFSSLQNTKYLCTHDSVVQLDRISDPPAGMEVSDFDLQVFCFVLFLPNTISSPIFSTLKNTKYLCTHDSVVQLDRISDPPAGMEVSDFDLQVFCFVLFLPNTISSPIFSTLKNTKYLCTHDSVVQLDRISDPPAGAQVSDFDLQVFCFVLFLPNTISSPIFSTLKNTKYLCTYDSVVQLDRISDFGSEG